MTRLSRSPVSARHRAQKRRRAGAAHRCRRARLRARGAQRALGAFAPALRRRLRRQDVRRAVAGGRVLRGAARAALRLSLARPARSFLGRAGRAPCADRPGRSAPATASTAAFQLEQDLRRALFALSAADRKAGAGQRARRGRGDRSRGGDGVHRRHDDGRRDVSRRAIFPRSGAAVTAGFLFDVPVRFDTDYLEVDLSAFAAGAIPKIPLVEIRP